MQTSHAQGYSARHSGVCYMWQHMSINKYAYLQLNNDIEHVG